MPMATPSFSRGTTRYRMVWQATGMMPPGIACSIRNAISSGRPLAIPHSADAAVNSTSVTRYTRLSPNRAPSQAPVGIATPSARLYTVLTHWTLSALAPNSLLSTDIATFTTEVSSTDMKVPVINTASDNPQAPARGDTGRRGSGAGLGGLAGVT